MSLDKYIHSDVEDKIYLELTQDQKIKFSKNIQINQANISKIG